MPWASDASYGAFSTKRPWLPIPKEQFGTGRRVQERGLERRNSHDEAIPCAQKPNRAMPRWDRSVSSIRLPFGH